MKSHKNKFVKTGSVIDYLGKLVVLGYISYHVSIYEGLCVFFLSPSYPIHMVSIGRVPCLCPSLGLKDNSSNQGPCVHGADGLAGESGVKQSRIFYLCYFNPEKYGVQYNCFVFFITNYCMERLQ